MEAIQITNILYLISAVAFILGIKRLSHPKTARSGNLLSSLGMLIAIIATLTYPGKEFDFTLILTGVGIGTVIGAIFATRVQMTEMPQMVAIFNGLGGAASAFVASSEFLSSDIFSDFDLSFIKYFEVKELIFDSMKINRFWLKLVEKYFFINNTDP